MHSAIHIESICILGGAGFIGRRLAAKLAAAGYRLRLLTRHRERNKALLVLPHCEIVAADIHDPTALAAQLQGCDAVINLVGVLHDSKRAGQGFKDAHVELARTVVQAAKEAGAQRLLHMSALNASAAAGVSDYLRTKGEAENLVHTSGKPALAVTSFRPSVVFGPEDRFLNRFAELLRIAPGFFPLACPNARFAPVYVDDLAQAMAHSLRDSATIDRHYEICGPKVYTLKQLVTYVAQLTGARVPVIGLNDRLSRLQARILGAMPGKPMTYDNYRSMQADSVCTENGLAALGVTPTALETVAPAYLGNSDRRGRYDGFRGRARRD